MRISDWSSDVCSSDLVARQGARDADAIDRDKDTRAADARARQGDDALEQRQAGGQIIPLVEEGADGGGRPDRDQIAATKMGRGVDTIKPDRRTLARVPKPARRRWMRRPKEEQTAKQPRGSNRGLHIGAVHASLPGGWAVPTAVLPASGGTAPGRKRGRSEADDRCGSRPR